ncbi:hypothetical protein [Hyunsoonleella pacifica]|uniref:Uncharacterized protein n=1 Tax=Hyunsoonleella pacifica TaxID=1080224 RepID=A0A4Q9FMN8_9FLAO|nr:hypothetical protein [Hyunsoonleella pacifica]TBN15692.1 hypothetical protein EYD46_11250 [Hyunsoonleella pacifica]GGD21857.1 hypothetical protein GCM10011368_24880 [Hyunsoonleella pacifica]
MKILKSILLLVFVFTLSCSESENSEEEQQQTQGSISIAFTNGDGFVMENIVATLTNYYETDQTLNINITADAEGPSGGKLTLTIVDNDDSFQALVNGSQFPIGDNTKSFYATLRYVDNTSTFTGATGSLDIRSFQANLNGNSNKALLSAVFSSSDGTVIMNSTISDLILNCIECAG